MDGIKHTLLLLKEENVCETRNPKGISLSSKEFLQQMEKEEVTFLIIRKQKVILLHKKIVELPIEINKMFHDFNNILVDCFPSDFPPTRSISHHIHLVVGESLPYKVSY